MPSVLSPCSAYKLHVHSYFLRQSVLTLCQSASTLSKRKLVRKWAWLDSRITASILAMPGPVAVCILESEKPTGPEIQGGGWGHPKGENGASQALCNLRSTPARS